MTLYPPVKKLAIYVRDLLELPEGLGGVVIGRQNIRTDNLKRLQIAVDALAPAVPLASSRKFDGDAEQMTYTRLTRQECTINFYGDAAYQFATRFQALTRSQDGYELQRDGAISVGASTAPQDVKELTGEQFSNRFEMVVSVTVSESVTVDTMRIDTAEFEVITDN